MLGDKVYTVCWNCGHKEWWIYSDPWKTKPRWCPKCGERFMSKEDKAVKDKIIESLSGKEHEERFKKCYLGSFSVDSPKQREEMKKHLSSSSFEEYEFVNNLIPYPDSPAETSGIFNSSQDINLNSLSKSFEELKPIKVYMWKKADVYKENIEKAPEWLADEFNILYIKHSEYIPEGKEGIIPYLKPYEIPDSDKKYDEVILLKHKNLGENIPDIDLSGRHLLQKFIE